MAFDALAAAFLVGLLGGGHCVAMCGGIITGLAARSSVSSGPRARAHGALELRNVSGALAAGGERTGPARPVSLATTTGLYSAGRVLSYTIAGTLAGALGSAALLADGVLPVQRALYLIACLVLVGLGLYLLGFTRFIAPLERIGAHLWRRVAPYALRIAPARTPADALLLGALWGWVPCGLVYSVLASAAASGTPTQGALTMLAFGVGTLPATLGAGALAGRLAAWRTRRSVRLTAGVLVILLGIAGALHAL
jgi:sulfite exporter TauE/SafE